MTDAHLFRFNASGEILDELKISRPTTETELKKVVGTPQGLFTVFLDYFTRRTYIIKTDEELQIERIQCFPGYYFTDLAESSGKLVMSGFKDGETRIIEMDHDLEVQRQETIAQLVGAFLSLNARMSVNESYLTVGLGHIAVNPNFDGSEINVIRVKTADLKSRCKLGNEYLPVNSTVTSFPNSLGDTEVKDFTLETNELEIEEQAIEVLSTRVCK
jgi:hypothetical protein